jgi:hypothetical protein
VSEWEDRLFIGSTGHGAHCEEPQPCQGCDIRAALAEIERQTKRAVDAEKEAAVQADGWLRSSGATNAALERAEAAEAQLAEMIELDAEATKSLNAELAAERVPEKRSAGGKR